MANTERRRVCSRPAKLGWVKPGRFTRQTRQIYAQDKSADVNEDVIRDWSVRVGGKLAKDRVTALMASSAIKS